ncbi:MAG: hypothetical protein LBF83_10195 [Spirochaetaceae bacterium]|nr:hypothetical protein [Spirochaetaceae bacterium]
MILFTGAKTRLILILCCLPLFGCLSSRSEPTVTVETLPAADPPAEPPPYTDREVDGVSFTPEKLSAVTIPDHVGRVSGRDAGAEPDGGARIGGIFRAAYREALMREMPLEGVLGVDEAHLWPEKTRLCWVQNWRGASLSFNNSWGIAGLTLAVLNTAGDRVFTVSGDILDMYGKSLGTGGENGVAGYGTPLTDVFFMKFTDRTAPVCAQRFTKGLIYVDSMGKGAFIAGKAPSGTVENDETAGFYPTDDAELRQRLKSAFGRAYRGLIDRHDRPVKADGPVEYSDFNGIVWSIETGEGAFSVAGLYVQQYDGGEFTVALPVLAGREGDGKTGVFSFLEDARTIEPPLSAIVNGNIRLPGAREITPHPLDEHGKKLVFLKSLALYGIPLTDSFVNIETMVLSQRFSNGVFRVSILRDR